MNGLFVLSKFGGHLMFHRSFQRNFGLDEPDGAPMLQCATCGLEHSDELNMSSLLFALTTYAADMTVKDQAEEKANDVPPITQYSLGRSTVVFAQNAALGVLVVVSYTSSLQADSTRWMTQQLCDRFCTKYKQRLEEAGRRVPTGGFSSFTKEVFRAVVAWPTALLSQLTQAGMLGPAAPEWVVLLRLKDYAKTQAAAAAKDAAKAGEPVAAAATAAAVPAPAPAAAASFSAAAPAAQVAAAAQRKPAPWWSSLFCCTSAAAMPAADEPAMPPRQKQAAAAAASAGAGAGAGVGVGVGSGCATSAVAGPPEPTASRQASLTKPQLFHVPSGTATGGHHYSELLEESSGAMAQVCSRICAASKTWPGSAAAAWHAVSMTDSKSEAPELLLVASMGQDVVMAFPTALAQDAALARCDAAAEVLAQLGIIGNYIAGAEAGAAARRLERARRKAKAQAQKPPAHVA